MYVDVCGCTNTCVHLRFFYTISVHSNFAISKGDEAASLLDGAVNHYLTARESETVKCSIVCNNEYKRNFEDWCKCVIYDYST